MVKSRLVGISPQFQDQMRAGKCMALWASVRIYFPVATSSIVRLIILLSMRASDTTLGLTGQLGALPSASATPRSADQFR